MADLSGVFKPADVATSSDAASDAVSKVAGKLDTAAFDGLAKITVGTTEPVTPSAGDLWVDTSVAVSNTVSDAISKIAVVSDVASDALSKIAAISDASSKALSKANVALSDASDAKSAASDAVSKIAAVSDAASDALSKIAAVSDVASDALSKVTGLSDTVSKLTVSVASDITSACSDTLSKAKSDAASKVAAALSDAKSYAHSDAASQVAALSDAVSKTESDIRSDYGSKIAVVSAAASDAASAASDAGSKAVVAGKKCVILKIYAEATAIAAGDGAMYFAVPGCLTGMNLVSCGGHLYTAATSGLVQVQLNNVTSGVDMLTHMLEWDATEKDTATATSAAVINTANDGVATGEEIRVDISAAGSGAKGMEVRLQFALP